MNKCKAALDESLAKIASFPDDYLDLKIKDNIPRETDWDALNEIVCRELEKADCTIVEQELDPFWKENRTFRDLLGYIEDNCNCDA